MNYYLYRSGQYIASFGSQAEGEAYVEKTLTAWRCSGAYGAPEYKLQYNPMGKDLKVWPAQEFRASKKQCGPVTTGKCGSVQI